MTRFFLFLPRYLQLDSLMLDILHTDDECAFVHLDFIFQDDIESYIIYDFCFIIYFLYLLTYSNFLIYNRAR